MYFVDEELINKLLKDFNDPLVCARVIKETKDYDSGWYKEKMKRLKITENASQTR